ncbi:MAG: DUF485 domain-containing protein [bacterium]|nr:DUF485 domain-containing protein [bacterium]
MHHQETTDIKTKLGLILFGIYALIYTGFIVINTLSPQTMGVRIFAGLNLAVVYGFGLIILAIVMGVIYNHICTKHERNSIKHQEPADTGAES